jgi:hypothetical protein
MAPGQDQRLAAADEQYDQGVAKAHHIGPQCVVHGPW